MFATIASVAIGMWFFAQGASGLVLFYNTKPSVADYSIVGVQSAKNIWLVSDDEWGDSLSAKLKKYIDGDIFKISSSAVDSIANIADTLDIAIYLSDSILDSSFVRKIGVIKFHSEKNSQTMLQFAEFLSIYHFKKRYGRGFIFDWSANGSQTQTK